MLKRSTASRALRSSDALDVEEVAQAVAEQIEAERDEQDGGAGKHRFPPMVGQEVGAARDHGPEIRRRRLHAEAEIRQSRADQDDEARSRARS